MRLACFLCFSSLYFLFSPSSFSVSVHFFFVFCFHLCPPFLHLMGASFSWAASPQCTPRPHDFHPFLHPLCCTNPIANPSLKTNHCPHHSLYNCIRKCSQHLPGTALLLSSYKSAGHVWQVVWKDPALQDPKWNKLSRSSAQWTVWVQTQTQHVSVADPPRWVSGNAGEKRLTGMVS